MRYQHILRVVESEPWLITAAAHETIRNLLASKLAGIPLEAEEGDLPQMIVKDGVAIVPVKGVIGKGLSSIEKSCGACGVEDVLDNLYASEQNPEVKAIMLDVDSPGGSVAGVPELGDAVASLTKPCLAFTDGQMDSAAYWIAAGANNIFASRSAEVGSIGVYQPWADQTQRYANAGVKMEVIKNTGGTYKGMGLPGTSLTEAQRAHLQQRVDDIFGMFTSHILASRTVPAEAMQGQTFMGEKAKAVGLIDEVTDFATAFRACQQLARS